MNDDASNGLRKPTESDFLRDLAADLKYVSTYGMVQGSHINPWSAAIRRALAAEAEVGRLRAAEAREGQP